MSKQTTYSFLPWLRRGFGTQIDLTQVATNGRAQAKLQFRVEGDGTIIPDSEVKKWIEFYGPGDITGIESAVIRATHPRRGAKDFEPNYFPQIEFREADFPWRYTPAAAAGNRLRPWIMLVVLETSELERKPVETGDLLPIISLRKSGDRLPLPAPDQLWAWAHVQVDQSIGGPLQGAALAQVLERTPEQCVSRLLSPRKLRPQTEYVAVLLPTFERGRLAGLGASTSEIEVVPGQAASWGAGQTEFPVYYQWSFRTGAAEDFESLARKITYRPLDPRIGKRWVDVQAPGYQITYTGAHEEQEGALLMEGALRLPQSGLPNLLEAEGEVKDEVFIRRLRDLLNLDSDLQREATLASDHSFQQNPFFGAEEDLPAGALHDDPMILPPLYGRWHAEAERVDAKQTQHWWAQLNLDPRQRIAAGLGTEAVRKNQEAYVKEAWRQYGDLFGVNDYLRKIQFSFAVNEALYEKHLVPATPERVVALSGGIQHLKYNRETTIKQHLRYSGVPSKLLSPDAEKIAGPNGFLLKKRNRSGRVTRSNPNQIAGLQVISQPSTHSIQVAPGLRVGIAMLLNAAIQRYRKKEYQQWKASYLVDIPDDRIPAFFEALEELNARYGGWVIIVPQSSDLDLLGLKQEAILPKMEARSAYGSLVRNTVQFENEAEQEQVSTQFDPIMKAPSFPHPMSVALADLGTGHLVPNLDLVLPNTIAALETNRAFIESYLVGVNHEMARELLWREYPTDQRGSYFRRFWPTATANPNWDIDPIHNWGRSRLGNNAPGELDEDLLVIVIRAELLMRFPHIIVYLQKAKRENGTYQLVNEVVYPMFSQRIDPDLYFVGFPRTLHQVRARGGHFLVIRERPGAARFGLDLPPEPASASQGSWDQLHWGDLGEVADFVDLSKHIPNTPVREGIPWGQTEGGHAANMAWILQQKRVLFARHIDSLLPESQ